MVPPSFAKTIMEHQVIQNLRAVSGVKSMFRQWHQKFTTALVQVQRAYAEMVYRLVREIDLGKELEKIVTGLRVDCGQVFDRASGDVWNAMTDSAEIQAYHKMIPKESLPLESRTAGSRTCPASASARCLGG